MQKPGKNIINPDQGIGVLKKSKSTWQIITPMNAAPSKMGGFDGTKSTKFDFDDDDKGKSAGGYSISKWGKDNKFPNNLKQLYHNAIVPGLMDFKVDMASGLDTYLYKRVLDEKSKKIIKDPILDDEIEEWLNSWDVFSFLLEQFTDYMWVENIFQQFIRSKNKKMIAELMHINAEECRLTVMENNKVNKIVVANWGKSSGTIDYKAYNIFRDKRQFQSHKVLMRHKKKPSFGFRYYNYPVYIGSLEAWLPLANEIPKFHLANMQNSLNIKYHIKIPVESLEAAAKNLELNKKEKAEWLNEKLDEIDTVLAGTENAAKAFYTFKNRDISGKELAGWEIIPIKNDIKEMSESYSKIIPEINNNITSAFQVDPSLANIQTGGKLSSGSDKLYSYNIHILTRTPIVRRLVLDSINECIKINWPNKFHKERIRFGIMDNFLNKQEEGKTGFNDEQNNQEI